MERPGRAAAGAAAAGAVVAAVAWRALWQEPRSDRVRELDLALPGWPPALDGLRVALVSDLHAGAPHVREARIERLVAAGRRARAPTSSCSSATTSTPTSRSGPASPRARSPRGSAALRAPLGVVAVLGNHDWANDGPGMRAALRTAGITVLENDAVPRRRPPVGRRRRGRALRAAPTSGAPCATSPTARP